MLCRGGRPALQGCRERGGAGHLRRCVTANIEVHLLDFNRDIYGDAIEVEFVEWLRPMRVFDSLDELIATVQGNIAWVRENL